MVEFAPNLMAVQLDGPGAAMLREKISDIGVGVHTSKATQQIVREANGLALNFADGGSLSTDMVVFSAGIRPQDALARSSGLAVGERGGICIDDRCRTSDPDVLAIGECALWENKIYGLVAPGYQMARTAAADLAGEEAPLRRGGYEHQTQAAGDRRRLLRRRSGPHARKSELSVDPRTGADL
ncbi:Nitric oxide reductase FlRd-NAD(+) reductase [Raoultella terrigena]|uniref:Nitric oxide reductase FlRd-NAD(+) reductase n=1 Tax=Raoultella terrigena TaxID=577 RepID=A0A4U9CWM0_RAOTE|nr:Nitric oxide reductase FlRd-NAD(+) reductase [Raoultella terrigena]